MGDVRDNRMWCQGYYVGYDKGRNDTLFELKEKARKLCNVRQVLEMIDEQLNPAIPQGKGEVKGEWEFEQITNRKRRNSQKEIGGPTEF